jgi:hypothetical protein
MGSGGMKAIMEERVFAIRHEQEAVPVTNLLSVTIHAQFLVREANK